MAWYIDANNVLKANGTEAVWTTDYGPGQTVPQSGIYKCQGCKREITSNRGDPFPPQSHHEHSQQGGVKWRLIIWTNTGGD